MDKKEKCVRNISGNCATSSAPKIVYALAMKNLLLHFQLGHTKVENKSHFMNEDLNGQQGGGNFPLGLYLVTSSVKWKTKVGKYPERQRRHNLSH